jgi:hypothetical protein
MRVLFCFYAPTITPGVFFLGPSHRAVPSTPKGSVRWNPLSSNFHIIVRMVRDRT